MLREVLIRANVRLPLLLLFEEACSLRPLPCLLHQENQKSCVAKQGWLSIFCTKKSRKGQLWTWACLHSAKPSSFPVCRTPLPLPVRAHHHESVHHHQHIMQVPSQLAQSSHLFTANDNNANLWDCSSPELIAKSPQKFVESKDYDVNMDAGQCDRGVPSLPELQLEIGVKLPGELERPFYSVWKHIAPLPADEVVGLTTNYHLRLLVRIVSLLVELGVLAQVRWIGPHKRHNDGSRRAASLTSANKDDNVHTALCSGFASGDP